MDTRQPVDQHKPELVVGIKAEPAENTGPLYPGETEQELQSALVVGRIPENDGENDERQELQSRDGPSQDVSTVVASENIEGEEGRDWEMKDGRKQALETDPYFYTKRDEFTSEVFKIEIGGLPLRYGYAELKKLLNVTLNLNSHKIKAVGSRAAWAFVTFKCEQDREKAMKVLSGYQWKGRPLSVKRANPAADPLIRKRVNRIELEGLLDDSKKIKLEGESENIPNDVRVKNAVMPLWEVPYEDQVKNKEEELKKILVKLGRQIERVCSLAPEWLTRNRSKNNFMCCPMDPLKMSPVTDQYRNKCEFTVGWNPQGEKTVGFRLTKYSQGSMSVADASCCTIVQEKMMEVCKIFQEYVRQSKFEPYDHEKHTGHWRQITIRTTRNNDIMAIVIIHPQDLERDELEEIKKELKFFFWDGDGKNCGITSLYFQTFIKSRLMSNKTGAEPPFEHVHGDEYIQERLFDMTFRISPSAFFQVNCAAAEVLYNMVAEFANVNFNTILIDVCCGTGTIGLTLAKKVKKLIGIELIHDAVEDARYNAKLNDLTNTEFKCGRVDDILPNLLYRPPRDCELVAVIDPPRAGLNSKVVKAIRACRALRQIVYVSCDPAAATVNLIDLCRPASKQYRERPFAIRRAVGVDLFPYTAHCELVVLLERDEREKT